MRALACQNAGSVLQSSSPDVSKPGGTFGIVEEEDEDEEDAIDVYDVPQAFSHFTYEASGGRKLVCDLQGTWNVEDGFILTDPVVHYVSSRNPDKKHKNGATDKGLDGIKKFFDTHQCNGLCERLGLKRPKDLASPQRMQMPPTRK